MEAFTLKEYGNDEQTSACSMNQSLSQSFSSFDASSRQLPSASEVFEKACASVVHIFVRKNDTDPSSSGRTLAHGSGVVWDSAGRIVTSAHVVSGNADNSGILIQVRFNNSAHIASVIAADMRRDVALILCNAAKSLPPLQRLENDECAPRTGDTAYVVGTPFGLQHTLSRGIISGTRREIGLKTGAVPLFNVIQTDAAVNPGCSGGPLLDAHGRFIGLTCAIASPSGAFAGVGFAIPISTVSFVIERMILHGRSATPVLGLLLSKNHAQQKGVRVEYAANSQSSVRPGDVLVGIDEEDVKDVLDVWRVIIAGAKDVGDRVKLTLRRNNTQTVQVFLTLADANEIQYQENGIGIDRPPYGTLERALRPRL